MTSTSTSTVRLVACITGIYFFFLTWGVMQERLASTSYPHHPHHPDTAPSRFPAFLLLNLCQAVTCAAIAWLSLWWHGLPVRRPDWPMLLEYGRVSACGTLASPFGYAALRHINYPTMVLGKSCKLLPLVLLNLLINKRRMDRFKYVTVFLITVGVAGFMFFEPRSAHKAHNHQHSGHNWVLGIVLLLINLLLDGATNSWQDEMFLKYRIRSHHMMFFMNVMSALMLSSFLIITNPFTGQLQDSITYIYTHPTVIKDMMLFCLCGAMGQVFIFLTIESFGSMVLVTVTVTRKLFTILLSLFWFNHQLTRMQWVSVGVVFVALAMESYMKTTHHHHHHHHAEKTKKEL